MLARQQPLLTEIQQGHLQSFAWLASSNRGPEYVRVLSVVVPELELCDVEREVLLINLVIRPDDAALQDAPESFNRIRVNGPHYILPVAMTDDSVGIVSVEVGVSLPLVSAKQADSGGDRFMDEAGKRESADTFNHAGHDLTLTADGSNHDSLTGTCATRTGAIVLTPLTLV